LVQASADYRERDQSTAQDAVATVGCSRAPPSVLAEGPGNAWSAGEPTDNVRTVSRSAADIPTAITRRFWDAHSKGWDEIRAQPAGQVYIAASIDKLVVVLPPRASVIDLGCGPGHHSAAIAGRGLRVTGVDYSSRMLERARAKHPGVIY
jgi:hypothetical protein